MNKVAAIIPAIMLLGSLPAMAKKTSEWYRLIPGDTVAVEASSPVTRLYGLAHRDRLSRMGVPVTQIIEDSPRFALRILNHWDNPDGTVERGYAGKSIWRWMPTPTGWTGSNGRPPRFPVLWSSAMS